MLGLEFWLQEEDFVQGRVVVKCIAEISGVYREETASYVISKHKAPHKVMRGFVLMLGYISKLYSNIQSQISKKYLYIFAGASS